MIDNPWKVDFHFGRALQESLKRLEELAGA
jgi:fructose-bisphosphate aldolase class 1